MPKPYQVKDPYFLKAKELGYRARSAFKLLEIQEKLHILEKNDHVLDLGASPGSWMQVAAEIVGSDGYVLGIDLETIKPLHKNTTPFTTHDSLLTTHLIQSDIFAENTVQQITQKHSGKFDVILSDLAPKTSGIKDRDQYKSVELNIRVLDMCSRLLKPGGTAVFKIFIGTDFHMIQVKVKEAFELVKQLKLKASRDRSYEMYVVGMGYMGKCEV